MLKQSFKIENYVCLKNEKKFGKFYSEAII